MRFAEFEQLSPDAREKAASKLSSQEVSDLFDEQPYLLEPLSKRTDAQYFESIEELHEHLIKHVVPEAKPWRAHETANHEFAHASCALKLGARGVAYYALDSVDWKGDRNQIYTAPYGPVHLPNLAFAAISMHPYDALQSITDTRNLRSYGYGSRDQVVQRIKRWNERLGDELEIPLPQPHYLDLLEHIR